MSSVRRRVPTHEASRILGVAIATLKKWRLVGKGPRFYRIGGGRAVRYDVDELERFAGPTFQSTTEANGHSGLVGGADTT